MSKVAKPKEADKTSPQNQCKPQLEPATKKILSSNKQSRPSLLDRASVKSLEEEDHKDVSRHFKSYIIQDRDIFCEKAKRIADTYDDGVYEGPAKVKEVILVGP